MPRTITKNASADDIIADFKTTAANVKLRKGSWLEIWERRKAGRILDMILFTERKHAELSELLPAKRGAVDMLDTRSDKRIGAISDEYWNNVGRPSYDPFLAVVFPGGIAAYTDGPDENQPGRMELLAELLVAVQHPLESPEKTKAWSDEIRGLAAEYRAALIDLDEIETQLRLYGRVKTSLAKVAQMELANLKRSYKAEGHSETEIHTVIPAAARPTQTRPAADEPPAGNG